MQSESEIQMDAGSLYREETFTDRRVGVIKRLVPVDENGEVDTARAEVYTGETQIMLGNNPLPIAFEIPAKTLGEAAEQFAAEARKAAEDTVKQLEEMRRDMANQIVVPGQQGGGGMPPGMGGGGSKIQMP